MNKCQICGEPAEVVVRVAESLNGHHHGWVSIALCFEHCDRYHGEPVLVGQ